MKSLVLPKNSRRHLVKHGNDLRKMLRACPHHGFTELTQIDTFYNGLNDNNQDSLNAAAGGNLLSKTTREALNIIENKSKVHYSRNKSNVSRMNTNSKESFSKTDERIDKLTDQILTLVEIVSKKVVTPATVKAVEESCVTCGDAHAYYNCPNTDNNQSSVCAASGTYNQVNPPNRVSNHMAPPGFAPVQNSGQNSGVAYEGPSIPTNPSPKKVVERETEETMDKEQNNFQGSTAHIQPSVNPIPIPEPDVSKTLPKPNIPYPSRRNDQKFREKASNQIEKIFQIFQDLRFNISFADALLLMPRFAPTIKNFLMNKDKLFELAKIPLNENCSAMLLKKLSEKLGDPGKFFIPCDFPGMDDSSKTSLSKLGKNFPTDFVVVDFEADPRVLLILGRSFLRTGRALIDHANESIKMINFIDVSCEDNFGEVLKFKKSNHFSSGSTTSLSDSHLSLISFETSDSLLEKFADELALLDPFPLGNEDVDYEADLREIELLLNRDPSTNFSPTITIDPNPESDINPIFKEILEDVESEDSIVSDFDEPVLLNTPLFDEDECFDPGGEINKIDDFLDDYKDLEGDVLEILHNTTHNLSLGVFFDHEPQCFKD
ncbi:hypothetical protein Tco_1475168 [Tanacetum coccineum]